MPDTLPARVVVQRLRRLSRACGKQGDPYALPPVPTKAQWRAWARICERAARQLDDKEQG